MSAAAVVIIISRPRQQANKVGSDKLGNNTEIHVLAPEGASDSEILDLALQQVNNGDQVE